MDIFEVVISAVVGVCLGGLSWWTKRNSDKVDAAVTKEEIIRLERLLREEFRREDIHLENRVDLKLDSIRSKIEDVSVKLDLVLTLLKKSSGDNK